MATLQPKFYKEGVLVPHLKMSIEVGTFASILHNENELNVKRIGQLIDYDVNDEGEKNLNLKTAA